MKKSCIYLNENRQERIEIRSQWVVLKYSPSYYIVHSIYFLPSVKNFFFRFPSVYIESLFWLFNFFKEKISENQKQRIYYKILNFIQPKKIYILDDRRHIVSLINACRLIQIESICYMHGQIYETHMNVFKSNPSKYFVWGDFFYKFAKENAHSTNIIKIKYPYFPHKKKIYKKKLGKKFIKNILLIQEFSNDNEIYYSKLKNILSCYNFFYRPKLRSDIKNKNNFFNIVNPKLNIFDCLFNNQIDLVIGFSSNILIESYLIDILSVSLSLEQDNVFSLYQRKYKLIQEFDNIPSIKDIDYLEKNYSTILKQYKFRVWGNETIL